MSQAAGTHAEVSGDSAGALSSARPTAAADFVRPALGCHDDARMLTPASSASVSLVCACLLFQVTKHADTSPHTTHKSFKTDRRDKPKHSGRLGATSGPKKGQGHTQKHANTKETRSCGWKCSCRVRLKTLCSVAHSCRFLLLCLLLFSFCFLFFLLCPLLFFFLFPFLEVVVVARALGVVPATRVS